MPYEKDSEHWKRVLSKLDGSYSGQGLSIGYGRYVLVYAVQGDWVLIRRSLSGSFAYTHRSNLKGFIRAK